MSLALLAVLFTTPHAAFPNVSNDKAMKKIGFSLLVFIALVSSACDSRMTPDIKQNPHPAMRYDVTITITGAPGPFDSVGGFMQYEVTNKACVPETGGPMNPMRLAPMSNPPIVFTKVADNIYKGTVYADYFLDEDYFGLGVCHWSLVNVSAELKIRNITLVPSISPDELFSQKSIPTYFVRQMYEIHSDIELSDFGEPNPSNYPPDRQKGIFTITLASREDFQ